MEKDLQLAQTEQMFKEISLERRLNFIDSLELEEFPIEAIEGIAVEKPAGLKAAEDKSASVDGAAVVSFVGELDALSKSDTLNSTLLAQLAANKKYDREKDPVNWYKFYSEVLQNVGWVIQSFHFEEYKDSSGSFEVANAVLKMMAAICTNNQLLALRATIDAFNSLTDQDGRVKMFEKASHSQNSGNFQLGTCIKENGQVVMGVGAVYFSTKQNVRRIFWFKFSSGETRMYMGNQSVTLNLDVYAQVRAQVIAKLGSHAKEYIMDLDI